MKAFAGAGHSAAQESQPRSAIPLIGLAHGSRHPGVVGSIEALMLAVAEAGAMPTAGAFLDLAQPDLSTVASGLGALGHRRAVVAPLLFTEAFHATVDVPEAIREAAQASGLRLVLADILGTGDDLLKVIRQAMSAAGIGSDESVLLLAVGSSSAAANDAIHDLADRLGHGRGGRVAAAFGTRPPRAPEVLADLVPPTVIVPLFLSPGLLLDPLARLAAERGMVMTPPLGELVAPLLVERYRQAFSRAAQ